MKKLLLSFALLAGVLSTTNAQVLQTENFNAATVGNVSTAIDGTTVGESGLYVDSSNGTAPTTSTNAGVTNVQIVASGNASQGLLIEGPNGDKGARYVWKDGLPLSWTARDFGNNIIEVEVDINPGGATTSRNTFGVYIWNAAFNRVLAGFVVRAATKELLLVAYSTPTGQPVGSYTYNLAAAPGIVLPENQFSHIGISYNQSTGQVRIKGPGLPAAGLTLTGSAAGTDPAEVDFVGLSGHAVATPNTSSFSMVMDNLVVRASETDTLGTEEITQTTNEFQIFPNPAANYLTVSNGNAGLIDISVTDLNGRTVKAVKANGATSMDLDVSNLSSGVYLISVGTENGTATKKFVKS